MTTMITLTEQEQTVLTNLAQQTGRPEDQILHDAISHYFAQMQLAYRRSLLQEARGIWQHRTDLPDLDTLRQEYEY